MNLRRLRINLQGYSSKGISGENRIQLSSYLDASMKLLKLWTIIAHCYANKYDIAVYHKNERFANTGMETWCQDIPKYEKKVRQLIKMLRQSAAK